MAGHPHLRSVDVVIVVIMTVAVAIPVLEMALADEMAGVVLFNARPIPVTIAGKGLRRRRHSARQAGSESHDGHQFFSFHAFSPFETLSW
jgi:uncharacterized MAPEG superfamily protein